MDKAYVIQTVGTEEVKKIQEERAQRELFTSSTSGGFIFKNKLNFIVGSLYPNEEPFPEWLVDLMVNIGEANSHQLVIE